ncbi:hypothetical protein [Nostoc sp.]|uniref:hypothetical protein n=1 Tax=Nostoc sp. TaxID=1180 RepID=UPI002FFAB95F
MLQLQCGNAKGGQSKGEDVHSQRLKVIAFSWCMVRSHIALKLVNISRKLSPKGKVENLQEC